MHEMNVKWHLYDFTVYAPNATWNAVGGVYVFAGINEQNQWFPLYIGQSESLAARLPTHERWSEAVQRGATHVHAMAVPLEANRLAIESDLIQRFDPPLNRQHRGY